LTVSLAFGLAPVPSLIVVMAIPEAVFTALGSAAPACMANAASSAAAVMLSGFMVAPCHGLMAAARDPFRAARFPL
jgi:hypothetical protein